MTKSVVDKKVLLKDLIECELKPYVKQIDLDAFYAESFLRKLGESGLLSSTGRTEKETLSEELFIVSETAKTCMTTAFCLWCHLAALTYVRKSENALLKEGLLASLESGQLLAGTGLSNPMKFYAGLENIQLKAEKVDGGYSISGVLPSVSNLGVTHGFGAIAALNDSERVMCFIFCNSEGLSMKGKSEYLGINGSATYACVLKDVFVPTEFVISDNADAFVEKIKPIFMAYQIPLGFGVIEASIQSIGKACNRQNGCNRFLKIQPTELEEMKGKFEQNLDAIIQSDNLDWKEIAKVRLSTAYLTLETVQAAMLHNGSAAYLKVSPTARRLKEAYFFANLTPTIKHLEKMLS